MALWSANSDEDTVQRLVGPGFQPAAGLLPGAELYGFSVTQRVFNGAAMASSFVLIAQC
jgi:hypothetical protein